MDDYFHLIKILQWSENNKAMTATNLFNYSLKTYNLPWTVRTEKLP